VAGSAMGFVQKPVGLQGGAGFLGHAQLRGTERHDVDSAELRVPVFAFRTPQEAQAALGELQAAGWIQPTDVSRLLLRQSRDVGANNVVRRARSFFSSHR